MGRRSEVGRSGHQECGAEGGHCSLLWQDSGDRWWKWRLQAGKEAVVEKGHGYPTCHCDIVKMGENIVHDADGMRQDIRWCSTIRSSMKHTHNINKPLHNRYHSTNTSACHFPSQIQALCGWYKHMVDENWWDLHQSPFLWQQFCIQDCLLLIMVLWWEWLLENEENNSGMDKSPWGGKVPWLSLW